MITRNIRRLALNNSTLGAHAVRELLRHDVIPDLEIKVVQTEVVVNGSVIAVDIPDLACQMESGATYLIDLVLFTSANASGGIAVYYNGGTATREAGQYTTLGSALSAAAIANLNLTNVTLSVGATAAAVGVTSRSYYKCASGGVWMPRFAQNASHASDTTVHVGSHVTLRRIA